MAALVFQLRSLKNAKNKNKNKKFWPPPIPKHVQ